MVVRALSPPEREFLEQFVQEVKGALQFPGYSIEKDPLPPEVACGFISKKVSCITGPFCREYPIAQLAYSTRKGKPVCSGAGLGSPAFWFPTRMKLTISEDLKTFISILDEVVENQGLTTAVEHAASQLKPTGLLPQPITEKEVIAQVTTPLALCCDNVVKTLIGRLQQKDGLALSEGVFRVADGQPFRLELLAYLAHLIGDPDAAYPLDLVEGVHLGDEIPLPDSGMWPKHEGGRDKAEERMDHLAMWDSNYRSWTEWQELAQTKVDEEVARGFICGPYSFEGVLKEVGYSEAEIKKVCPPPEVSSSPPGSPDVGLPGGEEGKRKRPLLQHEFAGPPGCATSRLGAVMEDLAKKKLRVVMDGTAAGVNGKAKLPERQETPSLFDVMSGLRKGYPKWFAIKVDVDAAFKRIKISVGHWRKTVFKTEKGWHFCPKLPFGMRASGFWWIRLNGLIHRIIQTVLHEIAHGGFMYVDDSLWLVHFEHRFHAIAKILALMSLVAVPISWPKTQLGTVVDWVGYVVDLDHCVAYLSAKKLEKFAAINAKVQSASRFLLAEVESYAGKLAWASVLCPMAKALLYPIFAALHDKDARARGKIYDVKPVKAAFRFWMRMIQAVPCIVPEERLVSSSKFLFRVDACASEQGAFLGGWICPVKQALEGDFQSIEYFVCEVPTHLFPQKKENPAGLISACEMLALVVGLRLWGKKLQGSEVDATILARSDSDVSVKACRKGYAKSPNLAFILREMCGTILDYRINFAVHHVPGKLNFLADALSRRRLEAFAILNPKNQKEVVIEDMFKEAMFFYDQEDHNPFTGVVVGNAKNPGPSEMEPLLAAGTHIALQISEGKFKVFCDNVPVVSIGEWKQMEINPETFARDLMEEGWPQKHGFVILELVTLCQALNRIRVSPAPPAPPPVPSRSGLRGEEVGREATFCLRSKDGVQPKKRAYSEKTQNVAKWANAPVVSSPPPGLTRNTIQNTKFQKVLQDSSKVKAAVSELQLRFYAESTWRSHASEMRLYLLLCEERGSPPFPLTVENVQAFAAVLFSCGYKSAPKYIQAITRQQKLIPPYEVPQAVQNYLPMLNRALGRDIQEPKHMMPVTIEMLQAIRSQSFSPLDKFACRMFIVEWFFMLRKDEVINLTQEDVTFLRIGETRAPGGTVISLGNVPEFSFKQVLAKKGEHRVRLAIRKDKTHQGGDVQYRCLDCVCGHESQANEIFGVAPSLASLCPVHALAELCSNSKPDRAAKFVLDPLHKPPGDSFVLNALRAALVKVGVPTSVVEDGVEIQLFGSHSLRRGGAQALAFAGWPLSDIKLFGRWLSDAVETYLLNVPLTTHGVFLADSMIKGAKYLRNCLGQVSESPGKSFRTREPQVGSVVMISAWDGDDEFELEVRIKSVSGDSWMVVPRDNDRAFSASKFDFRTCPWRLIAI